MKLTRKDYKCRKPQVSFHLENNELKIYPHSAFLQKASTASTMKTGKLINSQQKEVFGGLVQPRRHKEGNPFWEATKTGERISVMNLVATYKSQINHTLLRMSLAYTVPHSFLGI